jgi:hypothetical protein
MSESDWKLLVVVHSLDEVKTIAKSNGVCQYRTHNLANSTKYSFKCSQYRKYPICIYELKATVPDDDPNSNLYQVSEKTRVQPLGKRRGRGRPKKIGKAYAK